MSRRLLAVLLVAGLTGAVGIAAGQPLDASAVTTCPTTNPPNTLLLVGGTPQTAKLHDTFADMFQVTLANTNGCPITTQVAGTPVTFTAPSGGPGGTFSASGSNAVTVGTDASGGAAAPMFTANGSAGSYTLTASSDYGSVTFSLTNTASGLPATITPAGTPSQSATTGSRYGGPLEATVVDANGNPVEGVTVTFTLGAAAGGAGGAGSAAGASFDGGGTQATALTDSTGTATSPGFTANAIAGTFTATAATADVSEPATFALDNLAGKPPTISPLAPAKQSATVSTRYAKPLRVRVLGPSGSPLQGASVTFSLGVGSGAGSGAGAASPGASFVGGTSQVTEVTDASGIATSPRFDASATPGRFTATATTSGTTSAASFSLDNLAGKPPTIGRFSPAKESATVGASYGRPLQVKVFQSGKPLQGASVTFSLGSGGGAGGSAAGAAGPGASFVGGSSQVTELTDASGIATSPRFEASATPGRFTATATTAGTTEAASFSLDNLAGGAPTLAAVGDAKRSAIVGDRYREPLQAKVLQSGKPLQGATVTFVLGSAAAGATGSGASSAGASFVGGSAQATEVTNAAGVATSPRFEANDDAGSFTAAVTTAGSSGSVSFTLKNLSGGADAVTAGVAASESAPAGTRFPVPLAVTVTDKHGNPVPGTTVRFTAPASGASGRFRGKRRSVEVVTGATGVAVAPDFLAGRAQGGYVVRATVAGHSAAFALVNEPAP